MRPARVELSDANAFVSALHRHHKPVVGHRFSIGCSKDGKLVGVAICGRPVAAKTDQKNVLEITRLCTDGTKNACSFLYGAAARIARDMGFEKIQTFVTESEPATSLEAAGYSFEQLSEGKDGWQNRKGRRSDQPTCTKKRYGKQLN